MNRTKRILLLAREAGKSRDDTICTQQNIIPSTNSVITSEKKSSNIIDASEVQAKTTVEDKKVENDIFDSNANKGYNNEIVGKKDCLGNSRDNSVTTKQIEESNLHAPEKNQSNKVNDIEIQANATLDSDVELISVESEVENNEKVEKQFRLERKISGESGSDQENFHDFEDSYSEYMPSDAENEQPENELDEEPERDEKTNRNKKLLEERVNRKGRPRKGRKTKYPGQTFKTKKQLKDSNKEYYTIKGKLIKPKQFVDFNCDCPQKCNEKVSALQRESLFSKFWDLGSYNTQTAVIAAAITEQAIKRKRKVNSTKRTCTRTYRLDNATVCRNMFIRTYQISTKRVNTALQKIRSNNIKDQRGMTIAGKNKLPEETVNRIIQQIKKFPTYVSHYARAETEAKFLAPDLTIVKMHQMYSDENKNSSVSFSAYQKIFFENFNLRRKPVAKDTCNICDDVNMKIKNCLDETKKQQFQQSHNDHLVSAEIARSAMKSDFEKARTTDIVEVITYDMQKVLGVPKLPTNIIYYKRQLSIYNEGIHTASTETPYCFIWKEGIAGRGAQEVGSCIKKFIDLYLAPNTEELIMWSDSCGGQNRNIKLVLILKTILSSHATLKTISLKYLIPGHTFLPNDTDFGKIEKALKHQLRVYTLEDFKKIILSCQRKTPFVVTEMLSEDFFSTKELEQLIVNRKKAISGEKVSWLKTRVIKLEKDKPHRIFLKESHEGEEYEEIDIAKQLRGRPIALTDTKLTILYPEGKDISEKKLADIKSILPLIPKDVIDFYTSLKFAYFEDDIDGFGPNLDFELEQEN